MKYYTMLISKLVKISPQNVGESNYMFAVRENFHEKCYVLVL